MWLVRDHLTDTPNDYLGIVDGNGRVDIDDIVDELMAEGMELKRETAIDIVSRYNRKCIDLVLTGYSVNTGLVNMHATVRGTFTGKTWNAEHNRLNVSLQKSVDLRRAMTAAEVEILGEHADPIALFGISDLSTGKMDGTLTRGFVAELRGTFIRIVGEDPSVGVWLHEMETGVETRLPETSLVLNEPSRLLLLIPAALPTGEYELHVTTQFSRGHQLLRAPRTARLSSPLTVV